MGIRKIKLIGTEEDLDNGFYVIMTSGESSFCLRNEEYIVNEKLIELLRKMDIEFERIKEGKSATKQG